MKNSLRQTALARRDHLLPEEVKSLGREISANLFTLLQTIKPCTVGLFHPTRGEPDVMGLAAMQGLNGFLWSLPVCTESEAGPVLQFARYQPDTRLEAGRYNIPVPAKKDWVQPSLLLIPCVAFHVAGERLGYGAGWYDRTLSNLPAKPLTVGVAYSFAELSNRFAEPHDQLLDWVVTEQSIMRCGAAA